MQVFRSIEEIPAGFGPTVAAIGNFDGLHCGHREVLAAVVAEARVAGAQAVAVTFDPHPEQFLRPDLAPKLLTLLPERLALLAATGVDAVLVLPFDEQVCNLRARAFVESILVARLRVIRLHEGANFRFGCKAEAGVAELAEFGREFGFGVTVHGAVTVHGLEVSSSAIRKAVGEGDLRVARWMLGRSFAVHSRPARGRGIGSRLVVPTVNLAAYAGQLPAIGVYVTRLTVGSEDGSQGPELGQSGRRFQAVTNVGNRPTFGADSFAVESYILDFEPIDLTEETPLKLEFLLRLRGEKTWPSPEALKAQIMKDVARAQRYFRLASSKA